VLTAGPHIEVGALTQGGTTQRAINLNYLAALLLAVRVVTLGIGLFQA
jgi:hypothetical protein